ncbi:alpha/beta fold hydrolase [Elizabethkingia miricola]|uniref:alpha/beta fold hydrolase n=1 Tax=Elizabethkingia miricola TaxID=172045 RepID=UPI000B351F73|nr:alpha/beta hydrolase [Elizabethkingia miricola]NHQ68552.1 alpha/beta hydrolase [Elizabethkingia miricola]NHQ72219.1 alpha/beta hydrolase [Elizabethkingia miricola]NHQ79221.1 alpha/beta hydrolase [Elizabethkingia miricola]PSL89838.1 alpha/beta hydrolase [Elizabethkingia miricola]QHQ88438.1 alpha/beta hydrolase [Elizabethkingia miricola]
MKLVLKILKFTGKLIAGILILLLFSGLCYRLFSPKPVPPGKLVNVDGTHIHVRAEGEKKSLPTIIIEAGAQSNTDMLHWLAEGLKNHTRVIRYDRDGKWFSESSNNENISPEFYAHQLHQLLEKIGEKPPYILVGHSMGGPYIRIFRDLYPNEVEGIVFIDSSHPEQWKRLAQKELVPKGQAKLLKIGSVFADLGILGIYDNTIGKPVYQGDGLPKELYGRSRSLMSNSGEVYRMFLRENEVTNGVLQRAGKTKDLGSLPVLVFTAAEQYQESQKEKDRKKGIDPEKQVQLWFDMQKELKELSSNGKQIVLNASHGTIITKKENADIINKEILLLSENIVKKNDK